MDREQLIREIADKHSFKGYDHSPLSRDEVLEFIAKLKDLVNSKKREAEKLKVGSLEHDEFAAHAHSVVSLTARK